MPFLPTRGEASLITARFGKPASLFVGTHFWHGLTRQKQKAANRQLNQRGNFNRSLPPERPVQPPFPSIDFCFPFRYHKNCSGQSGVRAASFGGEESPYTTEQEAR